MRVCESTNTSWPRSNSCLHRSPKIEEVVDHVRCGVWTIWKGYDLDIAYFPSPQDHDHWLSSFLYIPYQLGKFFSFLRTETLKSANFIGVYCMKVEAMQNVQGSFFMDSQSVYPATSEK